MQLHILLFESRLIRLDDLADDVLKLQAEVLELQVLRLTSTDNCAALLVVAARAYGLLARRAFA